MYVKQVPVKPKGNGCVCCPTPQLHADLNIWLCVGFGCCMVTRDGEVIYDAMYDELLQLHHIEALAVLEPTCDWRLTMAGPLHGEVYQRHDDIGKWTCIHSDGGFA